MRDAVVPVLVDASRSMSLEDTDGARRIDRARDMVDRDLMPALTSGFHPELLRFGERLVPVEPSALAAVGAEGEAGEGAAEGARSERSDRGDRPRRPRSGSSRGGGGRSRE
jgi:hypothetical protein